MTGRQSLLPTVTLVLLLLTGVALTAKGLLDHIGSLSQFVNTGQWTGTYLLWFAGIVLACMVLSFWRGTRFAALLAFALAVLALGMTVPVIVTGLLALSAYALGSLVCRTGVFTALEKLLAGLALFGTLLSLLAHFPVNYTGVWTLLFALPLVLGRAPVAALLRDLYKTITVQSGFSWQYAALAGAAILHLLTGLMPEIGHDALATHLFVPEYLDRHHQWSFDAATYSWAVMPLFVDWLYAAGFMFGGEIGARLVNVAGMYLLAAVVAHIARWAGAQRSGPLWAAVLLLLTPVAFLETSSLFIEAVWASLMLGGTLALLKATDGKDALRANLLLAALLLGAGVAAKAVGLALLPALALLALVRCKNWLSVAVTPALCAAGALFAVVGCVPYVCAYVLTRNPVFPFFNAVFHSPLYPQVNFQPPAQFGHGFQWNTLYGMVFDSGRYLEGSLGAGGFEWLLLAVPCMAVALLVALLTRRIRTLWLVVLMLAWFWLVYRQTAYLRYVLPCYGLAAALTGTLLGGEHLVLQGARRVLGVAVGLTIMLNLLFVPAAGSYTRFDVKVLSDQLVRERYITTHAPTRSAIRYVNAVNVQHSKVGVFALAYIAELQSDALIATWYNPTFESATAHAPDAASLGRLLAADGIRYLVVDQHFKDAALVRNLADVSQELVRYNDISVRQLDAQYLFQQELLPSTDFTTGWQIEPGATRLPDGGVQVTAGAPAIISVPVETGRSYRYQIDAKCLAEPAQGRLQINWIDAKGRLVRPDIEVFDCSPDMQHYQRDYAAPDGATSAVLFATAHQQTPLEIATLSFRK